MMGPPSPIPVRLSIRIPLIRSVAPRCYRVPHRKREIYSPDRPIYSWEWGPAHATQRYTAIRHYLRNMAISIPSWEPMRVIPTQKALTIHSQELGPATPTLMATATHSLDRTQVSTRQAMPTHS